MNIGFALGCVWDVLARPQYIGAVLAIMFIHYRSVVLDFVYIAIKDGIMQTLFNLILNLADAIRGYYHMSQEIVRGLSQNYSFSIVDDNYGSDYATCSSLQRESTDLQNNDPTNVPDHNNIDKLNSSSGTLPQLVEVRNSLIDTEEETITPKAGTSKTAETIVSKSEIPENGMLPLEPAFLNRDEYPPGWLVFHPVLGVCSVQEADQYDGEQLVKKQTNENSETQS